MGRYVDDGSRLAGDVESVAVFCISMGSLVWHSHGHLLKKSLLSVVYVSICRLTE